jgi:5-methylcytosine-specific restriction protein A
VISEVLRTIIGELPTAINEPFKDNYLADYIRNEGPDLIREKISEEFSSYKMKGSAGQTGWVVDKDCWIGIFNPEVSRGKKYASQGYYVVYGFPLNSRYVTFGIGQSFTEAEEKYGRKNWESMIELHAVQMRAKIPSFESRFSTGEPEYKKEDGEKYYKHGFVYNKVYDIDSLPDEEELVQDLELMLQAFKELFEKGGRDIDADLRKQQEDTQSIEPEEEVWESEDSLVLKEHKKYERKNNNAIQKLKEKLDYPPCEVCGFNFEKEYGTKYIEAHHIIPISEMRKKGQTSRTIREKDLAMLCSNCHRMIHRFKELSVFGLKELLSKDKK